MRNLVAVMVVLAIAGIATAQTITIEPSDDMYTDPDHSDAHPVDELWVANYDPSGHHERIMMMFELNDYMGQEIDSAMLNLNRFFGCPSGDPTHTNFYNITAPWGESSWPENTHISHSTTVWANYVFNANGWHRIDITTLVQEWLDGTTPNYGFVIEAIPGNKFSKFYSKEAASSVRPYLELFGATGIDENHKTSMPENLSLNVFPNPFNSECRFTVHGGQFTIWGVEIFDMKGRSVWWLGEPLADNKPPITEFIWQPDESVGSGVYLVRAKIGDRHAPEATVTKRVVYLK